MPHVTGKAKVRGFSQAGGVGQVRGFSHVRGFSQGSGVLKVRGGCGEPMGSARHSSRPAWIGPPYTQISPFVTIENVPASRSSIKRKEVHSLGKSVVY
jgi:hypothetical protein